MKIAVLIIMLLSTEDINMKSLDVVLFDEHDEDTTDDNIFLLSSGDSINVFV